MMLYGDQEIHQTDCESRLDGQFKRAHVTISVKTSLTTLFKAATSLSSHSSLIFISVLSHLSSFDIAICQRTQIFVHCCVLKEGRACTANKSLIQVECVNLLNLKRCLLTVSIVSYFLAVTHSGCRLLLLVVPVFILSL